MAAKGRRRAPDARQATRRRPRRRTAGRRPGPVERALRWILYLVLVRLGLWIGLRVALVAGTVLAGATTYYYLTLPPAQALLDGRDRGSVTMLDRQGRTFAWRGQQYTVTRADAASPHLVNAVLATEDRRFSSISASTRAASRAR